MESSEVRLWLILTAVVLSTVFVGWLFITDVDAGDPGAVDFDETVQIGLTDADRLALGDDIVLPKAQITYGSYRYVVGYYGIDRAAFDLTDEATQRQLGYPLTVYVTDYTLAEISLDEAGHPRTENPIRWRPADELYYVVDSEARSPSGPATIPFADKEVADAFVDEYGGDILDWDTLLERTLDAVPPGPTRSDLDEQHQLADSRLDRAGTQLNRPVSITVGQEAETIQAAIDAAENETTVIVPAGTYEEQVTIDRPITLRGDGATIDGGGNGSVVRLEADGAALADIEVVGTGDQLQDPDAATGDPDEWDHNIELGYGHGDAAVAAVAAEDVAIVNVSINTRANGILLRDAPGTVIDDVSIEGTDYWRDGFMGVMAMRSPGVIQESAIAGGRDSVYMHRSHDMVIRDNFLADGRFGLHLMHTSGTLLANNTIRGHDSGGIILMTDPEANAIVDNDIRQSNSGITTVGSRNLVAGNVVVNNVYGLRMSDHETRYEGNVVFGNDIGIRVAGFLPTNTVTANDIVDNQQQLEIGFGPLEVWTHDGIGNYWGLDPTAGVSSTIERTYSPVHPVDIRLDRVDGSWTLANSPGIAVADAFQDSIPGLRQGVVDLSPLASPVNPALLEQAREESHNETVVTP